jgi:hypothetical protein
LAPVSRDEPRRNASDGGTGWDVAGNHGTRPDERSFPDRHATHHHGTTADRRTAADACGHNLPVNLGLECTTHRRPRVTIVDEEYTVPEKNLILDRHALADERVRRHLAASTDVRAFLDLHEGPDPGTVTDFAPVEIHEVAMMNHDPLSKPDVGLYGHA